MKTKAVRLYGKKDLRLEEFELPEIKEDDILGLVISDSICMSTYKAVILGTEHKRVPPDIASNPVMVGHELCGEIVRCGSRWKDKYAPGSKFAIQPALNSEKNFYFTPGYSFPYLGGNATYVIIPPIVMEKECLLDYNGDAYFYGSLAEPMSTIIGAFHSNYHTKAGIYIHEMGVKKGGNMAILAGAGPMGLGAIDYAIHNERKPQLLVVTDIDQTRLDRAASILTADEAAKNGVKLVYANTSGMSDAAEYLVSLTDGKGYDDVFVFAPVRQVAEQGDRILGRDGCMNFFAGPTDTAFSANVNFYNVHYNSTHMLGMSGGNTNDMAESLVMMEKGLIDPSSMITHIGGLNAVIPTTLNLPSIPGGKKLIYTNIDMELTAIADFEEKGRNESNDLLLELAGMIKKNKGLWSGPAEKLLLSRARKI